jgi:hypothetical protein
MSRRRNPEVAPPRDIETRRRRTDAEHDRQVDGHRHVVLCHHLLDRHVEADGLLADEVGDLVPGWIVGVKVGRPHRPVHRVVDVLVPPRDDRIKPLGYGEPRTKVATGPCDQKALVAAEALARRVDARKVGRVQVEEITVAVLLHGAAMNIMLGAPGRPPCERQQASQALIAARRVCDGVSCIFRLMRDAAARAACPQRLPSLRASCVLRVALRLCGAARGWQTPCKCR